MNQSAHARFSFTLAAEDTPPSSQRRSHQRKRVLRGAIVSYAGGKFSFSCTIRDLSLSCARLVLPSDQTLPSRLFVVNIRDRLAHESEVVWHRGTAVGVRFLSSLSLNQISDPGLKHLKDLWQARTGLGLQDT